MFSRDLELRDLVSLEEWQRIQDSFSEALEVSLRTVSLVGKLLTRVSRPNRLCGRILPDSPVYNDYVSKCSKCVLKAGNRDFSELKEEAHFKCPLGLDLFVVPVTTVGGRIVAHMIIGPLILNRRKDTAEYARDAQTVGLSLEELLDMLLEINVFSFNRCYSVTKLIRNIFSYIAQTAYHKKRLAEMAPELIKMDPLFSRYYEEKIFNSLLNACILALDADSGSVMTVDKKTQMLHIKAAAKLDEAVVSNTELKIGEGIAGLAAASAKPIILPKDGERKELAGRMKRSYIKSSMIVPFKKPLSKNSHNDVYGVINLNIVRKEEQFSENNIAFVQELLNLVSTVLVAFQ